MADVFISYARKDQDFVRRLHQALVAENLEVWVDYQDIQPAAEFPAEIQSNIISADAVGFVISPDSVVSDWCLRELSLAVENNKRLVPMLYRETATQTVPEALRSLNWILFREGDDFDRATRLLIKGVKTDLAWVRLHTRLLGRAKEWLGKGRDTSLLLRGKDLQEAEHWLAQGATKEPKPTQDHISYIVASRKDVARRQKITLGAVSLALLVAIILILISLNQSGIAQTQSNVAQRQTRVANSRQLAAQSISHVDQQYDLALLLAVEADAAGDTFEARHSLLTGLQSHPGLMAFLDSGDVGQVSFSPDSTIVASDSDNGAIILWDVATQQKLAELTGSNLPAAFNPAGKTLATGSSDKTLVLWDVSNPKAPFRLGETPPGQSQPVTPLAFRRDGKMLASGSGDGNDTILLWDVSNPNAPVQLGAPLNTGSDAVMSVAFSPDGKTLASSHHDQTVVLWDVSNPEAPIQMTSLSTGQMIMNSVAFSPDGKTLAAGGGDNNEGPIVLWDVATRQPLGKPLVGHASQVNSVSFSPDGKTLASGSIDGTVMLWDVAARKRLVDPLVGHTGYVSSVAFSPDGKTLASGGSGTTVPGSSGSIILWNVPTALEPDGTLQLRAGRSITDHLAEVGGVAFDPECASVTVGQTEQCHSVVATEAGGQIILWDAVTLQPLGDPLKGGSYGELAFSTKGKMLAATNGDTVAMWDVSQPRSPKPLGPPLAGHTDPVHTLAFSPDGKTLASAGVDHIILFWDTVTQKKRAESLDADDEVFSVAFNPEGRMLAAASSYEIGLWDLATSPVSNTWLGGHEQAVYSVAFSPDSKLVAAGGEDKTIILWDMATRQPLGKPLTGNLDTVFSLAFSPDSTMLASGNSNGIILWDVGTRQPLGAPLTQIIDPVYSVAFSPDGKLLASGRCGERDQADQSNCIQGELILWDVDPVAWRAHACQIAGRNLTRAEWQQYMLDEPYHKTCEQWPEGK